MPPEPAARRPRLLLVDDDELLCQAVTDHLGGKGVEVRAVHRAAEALAACAAEPFDVVVLDEKLPDGEGSELCGRLREASDGTRIVFATAYPSFDHALRAVRAGAHGYLCKPFELEELWLAVERCLEHQRLQRAVQLRQDQAARDGAEAILVGALPALREILARATASDAPVLVTGETGTGKNLVARAIHHGSPRRRGALVALNCAALPEQLIEAELFGWERGAFTGAVGARSGVAEMADGGTLFLDEIGDMPLHLQAKLLSLIEEQQVRRLGGRAPRPVDLRVVAATNRPLEEAVAAGAFRADLYYRLDVLRVRVPPLRERRADLPALCAYLVGKLAGRAPAPSFAPGELERLAEYGWPGNVRELRNVIERSVVLHRDPLRPSEFLGPAAPAPRAAGAPGAAAGAPTALAEVERRHILAVLEAQGSNLARTARALEISLSTLKRKLRSYAYPSTSSGSGPERTVRPAPPAAGGPGARPELRGDG
jgi:DNA-binding NtrC family response regulator